MRLRSATPCCYGRVIGATIEPLARLREKLGAFYRLDVAPIAQCRQHESRRDEPSAPHSTKYTSSIQMSVSRGGPASGRVSFCACQLMPYTAFGSHCACW